MRRHLGTRLIAEWFSRPEDEIADLEADRDANAAEVEAGQIDLTEGTRRDLDIVGMLTNDWQSTAWHAVVLVQEEEAAPPAGPPPA